MAPRPRKHGRDLPDNLYQNGGYFRYRHPLTGKWHGMGADRESAIQDARDLNAVFRQGVAEKRVAHVTSDTGITVAELVRRYWTILTRERKLRPNTIRTRTHITDMIVSVIGRMDAAAVEVHDCAGILNRYIDQDKGRMAQSVRSVMVDLFRVACSEGIRKDNPAALTRPPLKGWAHGYRMRCCWRW